MKNWIRGAGIRLLGDLWLASWLLLETKTYSNSNKNTNTSPNTNRKTNTIHHWQLDCSSLHAHGKKIQTICETKWNEKSLHFFWSRCMYIVQMWIHSKIMFQTWQRKENLFQSLRINLASEKCQIRQVELGWYLAIHFYNCL